MEETKTTAERYEEAKNKLQKELDGMKKKNEMREDIKKIKNEINTEKKKNSWLFKFLKRFDPGDEFK